MTTSEKFRQLKEATGRTTKEISLNSGIPLGTLNKILSGETKSIKAENIKKLAEYFNVPISYFIEEKEDGEKKASAKDFPIFIRCAAVTPDLVLGDPEKNAEIIVKEIEKLSAQKVNVAVFPELCLSGYTLSDLFYMDALLKNCEKSLDKIRIFTYNYEMIVFVGCPLLKDGAIYNTAVAISKGKILGVVPKTFLPDYNEFYEKRQFTPAPKGVGDIVINGKKYPFGTDIIFSERSYANLRISAEICEDLWVAKSPSVSHCLNGATMIVNLSASNELVGKAEYRKKLVSLHSAKTVCAYVYADAGAYESTTDVIFAGHNIISENGKILSESELFSKNYAIADVDLDFISFERRKLYDKSMAEVGDYLNVEFSIDIGNDTILRKYPRTPFVPDDDTETAKRAELILNIQANALARRLSHVKSKTAVIGVSGGLDSTLALLVACRAMDILKTSRKSVIGVTMPCFGTTERTKSNSIKLAEELGVTVKEVDITESVRSHFRDIEQDEETKDVTYENAQARERTQVLMDIANKTGGIVIGTGDLSELALGWSTYNGDHMSMYGVNSSVPKTLVRYIVKYAAEKEGGKIGEVLDDICNTPVSPELIPAKDGEIVQKTEDIVGPYVLHDFFLYHFVRAGFSPSKIFYVAVNTFEGEFTKEEIYKWLEIFIRRFFAQQFKRSCVPDGVKIGSVSLSPRGDWRMPSDSSVSAWLNDLKKVRI